MRLLLPFFSLTVLLTSCSRPAATTTRMIVLGVDGMDPAFLEAHWEQLPNLNRLRKTGDFRRLGTSVPPQSPVAWSSVITGMDPGGHGIFDFIHRDPATRMPVSSLAESAPPGRMLHFGPYVLPLSAGSVRTLRAGKAFWQVLSERGINSTVIRMPANYPPAECEAESLSGMGTPDMEGSFGTFTFFTDDPAETRSSVSGGRIAKIALEDGRAGLSITGPPNGFRRDRAATSATVIIDVDPSAPVARVDTGGTQIILKQGEWSDWLRVRFPLVPGKSASGMIRVYLQQAHPHFRVYVSPVNIDPDEPALPISTPASYSRTLAAAVGPFYTQGIAEEAAAFRAGILNRAEFLTQSRKVLEDSLRMFRHELDKFSGGLLFYYFSSVDQNSHMLWGKHAGELLEIYRDVDKAIGEAIDKAGAGTTLMVISDHGFASFDRAVHLNAWLRREGFLRLDDPSNAGDEELFQHVDWGGTKAYALGLNGVYLNLEGREPGGAVSVSDKATVLEDISKRLLAFRDPDTGESVVSKIYLPETSFRGRNLKHAPDVIVGFRRGYRASWQTALGAVPRMIVEENTQTWIGDHCMAADEVPGVLLSNRKVRSAAPQLYDIPVTILKEFSIAKTDGMIGEAVF